MNFFPPRLFLQNSYLDFFKNGGYIIGWPYVSRYLSMKFNWRNILYLSYNMIDFLYEKQIEQVRNPAS